jgi:hypothetical protein
MLDKQQALEVSIQIYEKIVRPIDGVPPFARSPYGSSQHHCGALSCTREYLLSEHPRKYSQSGRKMAWQCRSWRIPLCESTRIVPKLAAWSVTTIPSRTLRINSLNLNPKYTGAGTLMRNKYLERKNTPAGMENLCKVADDSPTTVCATGSDTFV